MRGAIQAFDQALEASDGMWLAILNWIFWKYRAEAGVEPGIMEAAAKHLCRAEPGGWRKTELSGKKPPSVREGRAVDKALSSTRGGLYAKDPTVMKTTQESASGRGQGLTDAERFDDAMGLYKRAP